MTLRNANKRAKRRKAKLFFLEGHKTFQSFIEAKLQSALEVALRQEIQQKISEFYENNQPSGILDFLTRPNMVASIFLANKISTDRGFQELINTKP